MNIFESILLGIIQGITEFLPVSSSAHLAIAQHLMPKFSQPGILFDVILHAGTLVAVIVYFRTTLLKLSAKMILLLAIGTIPAVVFGFLFSDWFEASFGNIKMIGIELIITGIFIYFVDYARQTRKSMNWLDAAIIGVAQAIAIIPGISRSGATIFAGVFRGLPKKDVANFSFLLSIPAILGAIVLQLVKYGFNESTSWGTYSVGFFFAFLFGFLSIGVLLRLLATRNFKVFAIYCWIVGVAVVLLS
jgi:undecaprenyl-diphosphatase